jgi:hypothetical protein
MIALALLTTLERPVRQLEHVNMTLCSRPRACRLQAVLEHTPHQPQQRARARVHLSVLSDPPLHLNEPVNPSKLASVLLIPLPKTLQQADLGMCHARDMMTSWCTLHQKRTRTSMKVNKSQSVTLFQTRGISPGDSGCQTQIVTT